MADSVQSTSMRAAKVLAHSMLFSAAQKLPDSVDRFLAKITGCTSLRQRHSDGVTRNIGRLIEHGVQDQLAGNSVFGKVKNVLGENFLSGPLQHLMGQENWGQQLLLVVCTTERDSGQADASVWGMLKKKAFEDYGASPVVNTVMKWTFESVEFGANSTVKPAWMSGIEKVMEWVKGGLDLFEAMRNYFSEPVQAPRNFKSANEVCENVVLLERKDIKEATANTDVALSCLKEMVDIPVSSAALRKRAESSLPVSLDITMIPQRPPAPERETDPVADNPARIEMPDPDSGIGQSTTPAAHRSSDALTMLQIISPDAAPATDAVPETRTAANIQQARISDEKRQELLEVASQLTPDQLKPLPRSNIFIDNDKPAEMEVRSQSTGVARLSDEIQISATRETGQQLRNEVKTQVEGYSIANAYASQLDTLSLDLGKDYSYADIGKDTLWNASNSIWGFLGAGNSITAQQRHELRVLYNTCNQNPELMFKVTNLLDENFANKIITNPLSQYVREQDGSFMLGDLALKVTDFESPAHTFSVRNEAGKIMVAIESKWAITGYGKGKPERAPIGSIEDAVDANTLRATFLVYLPASQIDGVTTVGEPDVHGPVLALMINNNVIIKDGGEIETGKIF